MRVVLGIVHATHFERPATDPVETAMDLTEAADIDRPEIHRWFTADDPLRQGLAGTAAGTDTIGIERTTNVEISQLRRFAEDVVAI